MYIQVSRVSQNNFPEIPSYGDAFYSADDIDALVRELSGGEITECVG
ncbi:hypothetical protein [Methanosarcina spelaei]|nr:hypothetical protein [Methanosarcina spelaei]